MTPTPLIASGLADPLDGQVDETPAARFTRLKSAVIRGRILKYEDIANPFPAGSAEARCFDHGRGRKTKARKDRRDWPQEDLDLLAYCEALPPGEGQRRAIPCAELAAYFGVSEVAVRQRAMRLRRAGSSPCAGDETFNVKHRETPGGAL